MRGHSFRSALVGGVIGALVIGVLTPVGAAVGDYVTAGVFNSADATTVLKGDADEANLRLVNLNPNTPALELRVDSGPSLKVDTKARIPKLNADLVDGMHAYKLMIKSHYDADADGLVDDADQLDGLDGTEYRNASNINSGTLSTARFDSYADLGDSGRLDNDNDADILTRLQADGRFLQDSEAYTDLNDSGRLDNNNGNDLLTRTMDGLTVPLSEHAQFGAVATADCGPRSAQLRQFLVAAFPTKRNRRHLP